MLFNRKAKDKELAAIKSELGAVIYYYQHIIRCFNCSRSIMLYIPKGVTVSRYKEKEFDHIVCEYCGCVNN